MTEEINTHLFLAQHDLAPPLLARFENGLLYPFVPGRTCGDDEIFSPSVFCGVARHLAKWHAALPQSRYEKSNGATEAPNDISKTQLQTASTIWTVMANWISELPESTQEQCDRRLELQGELSWMKTQFSEKDTEEPNVCCQQYNVSKFYIVDLISYSWCSLMAI